MERIEEYDNEILNIFKDRYQFSEKFLSERLVKYLKDILNDNKNWVSIRNIVIGLKHGIKEIRLCQHCLKELTFSQMIRGTRFCSKKCSSLDIDVKSKKKENSELSCLKKYGVKYTFQVDEFKDKAKQTCLEKYGVEYSSQNAEIRFKFEQTMLKKYGVKNALQNNDILKKSIKTNLSNHNGNYNSTTIESKEKAKRTCLEKYGCETFTQTELFKEKLKQSIQNKIGFKHYKIQKSWEMIQKWEKYRNSSDV